MYSEEELWDSPESSSGVDLSWIAGFLSRQHRWILAVTGLALVPALSFPLLPADVYEARARVQVKPRPEVMQVGANPVSEGPISYGQNPLTREQLIAVSEPVLGRVVDQLPPLRPREPSVWDRLTRSLGLPSSADALTPEQVRMGRVRSLARRIEVDLAPSGDFLDLVAVASEPSDASFLANAVAEAVVEYNAEEQNSDYERSLSWIHGQVLELRSRIGRNTEELGRHVAEHDIVTDSDERRRGSSLRASVAEELTETEIELQGVRARLRELPGQGSSGRERSDYDPELARVQQRFETARTALDEARQVYRPTHPEVRRLEAALDSIERELEMWGPAAVFPSSSSEEDQRQYRELAQQRAALEAKRSALRRRLESLSGENVEKSEALAEYDRLEHQLSLDREMLDMMMRKREEAVMAAAADYTRARVVERAVMPIAPVGPPRLAFAMVGIVLALGAGVGCGAARELIDPTVRDPKQVGQLLGSRVLAMVPLASDGAPPERQSEGSPSSLAAESYRNLRTSLLFSSSSQSFTTLVVTSGLAGEGKTTVSVNLASSFAQFGRAVLLIDADMRRPRLHRVFGVPATPGLSELLRGDAAFDAVVRRPADGRFDVVLAGVQPPNPSELIASADFGMLLSRARAQYDLVLVDSPVLLGVSDSQLLASQADATLVVQKPGKVDRRAVREMRNLLEQAGARVLGVVLNQVERSDRHFYPAYLESPYLENESEREAG